ncbi:prolyl aminopeptidase [Sansalvadorimonas sp. 2012CJ34-2]|uniref:Proline iminopeptidase n=1 Tax=Parendozoicomonas callyspongiae TaxID=2942213 RepID=A0ABT0PEY0_9GAMM|nr:prolyl aminopeptidase [Sansalvadorimonas sp. 2012CJ34-2]MCL6269937.1 prolyl aminopeptidase [Sansalvadorimonas sp. 2012CJ34-2]
MLTLYPPIKPYARHNIAVSGDHSLYVDESGNPEGIPVLFLHGGPGAACDKHSRRYFDPQMYRIIIWDQRGCGRSEPHASTENNTTDDLVADMEVIRKKLKIDKWLLFGGSWGAALGLIYASRHPAKVFAMVMRGVFLGRESDIRWLFSKEGAGRVFPDYWQELVSHFPKKDHADLVAACHDRLVGNDELARMGAAKALCTWCAQCSTLRPNQEVLDSLADPHRTLALARISSHYMSNNLFLDSQGILPLLTGLDNIPGIIVHGRYDMICPLENAQTLQEKWPGSKLHIVRDAGHSANESGIRDALVRATDEMARRFKAEFGLGRTS